MGSKRATRSPAITNDFGFAGVIKLRFNVEQLFTYNPVQLGRIGKNFQEFINAMRQYAGQSPDEKIKFLFKVYDIDGR